MPTINIGNNTGNSGSVVVSYLTWDDPETVYSSLSWFAAGPRFSSKYKGLMRFDLSDIPSVSVLTINSATLYLYDQNPVGRTSSTTTTLHEVSTANGDWLKSSAVWNYKVYNTVTWAGSSGLETSGTDYVDTLLGNHLYVDGTSGYGTGISLNSSGLAVIKKWAGTTGGNGLLVYASSVGASYTIFDSELGINGRRPYLSINYTTSSPFPGGRLI